LREIANEVTSAAGAFDRETAHVQQHQFVFDDRGWRAIQPELNTVLKKVRTIEAQSAQRLSRGDGTDERRVTMVSLLFGTPLPATDARSA
jgi:hypothetical protein